MLLELIWLIDSAYHASLDLQKQWIQLVCFSINTLTLHMKTQNNYLYFEVWQVKRSPEKRTEVRYGGDFPPGLDLFHGYCTSLGHFSMVLPICLTLVRRHRSNKMFLHRFAMTFEL